jgi:hypothetical protein
MFRTILVQGCDWMIRKKEAEIDVGEDMWCAWKVVKLKHVTRLTWSEDNQRELLFVDPSGPSNLGTQVPVETPFHLVLYHTYTRPSTHKSHLPLPSLSYYYTYDSICSGIQIKAHHDRPTSIAHLLGG